MKNSDWEIPTKLQPDASALGYDLERALGAIVGIRTIVPDDAFTANSLGTERAGSGVIIREDGLVLTIGYLITEAETIWIATNDGRVIPGHALAIDGESGFGLVQPLARMRVDPLRFADPSAASVGTEAVFASSGGRRRSVATRIVGCEPFAGYWEYALDEAIFTAPAHPFWGGGGLIAPDGRLLGIGSLILQQRDRRGRQLDMNMIVPIGLLPPVLDDLLAYGQVHRPARPWLGLFAMENDGGLVVGSLADGGPAERAGIRAGDRILAIGGQEVTDLGELWRRLWASGPAGTEVTLRLGREDSVVAVTATSADRQKFLRPKRLH